MDRKVNTTHAPSSPAFTMLKNIIIAQNHAFLERVADESGLDVDYLKEKYLKPDYYLPIIKKTCCPSPKP